MDFNEMNKKLGDATAKESRINQLTNELFKRGLCMTMDSAKQMATSMVETEYKVQKRFQEQARPVIGEGRPSYSEVARDSVAKRTFVREEPVLKATPREETPRMPLKPEISGLSGGKTLRELQEEYDREHGAVQATARKENIEALRENALKPAPVNVRNEFETPSTSDSAPKMAPLPEPLNEDDFIEIQPEHFPSEVKSEEVKAEIVPLLSESPEILESTVEEILSVTPDASQQVAITEVESEKAEIQPASEEIPVVSDVDVQEDGFITLGNVAVPAVEPDDEDVLLQDEAEKRDAKLVADPVPEKPKRDLAKEHGIDINSIFMFRK